MKKKMLIAFSLGAMMLCMLVLPVSAEDTANMNVTYREPNSYTVTIPATVNLSAGATSKDISVSNVNLEPNKEIKIKISSGLGNGGVIELSRKDDTATKAVTTISTTQGGAGIAPNTDFVTFTANGSQALYFTALQPKEGTTIKAGDYSATLTFTVTAPETN